MGPGTKIGIITSIVSTFVCLIIIKPKTAFSADYEIVCDESSCDELVGPIFDINNFLPGDNIEKSINIRNKRSETLDVSTEAVLGGNYDDIFLDKLELTVLQNLTEVYNGPLSGYIDREYDLGDLSENDELEISYEIYFPTDAGNEYQQNLVTFDLIFIFTGQESEEEEVVESSNTSTVSGNDNGTNSSQGDVLGSSTAVSSGELLGLSDTNGITKNGYIILFAMLLGATGITLIISTSLNKR